MVVWGVLAGTRGEWTGILMAGRERSPLARDECMWCCPLVRPVEGPRSGATERDMLRPYPPQIDPWATVGRRSFRFGRTRGFGTFKDRRCWHRGSFDFV